MVGKPTLAHPTSGGDLWFLLPICILLLTSSQTLTVIETVKVFFALELDWNHGTC